MTNLSKRILPLFFIFIAANTLAQKATISGTIKDASNGEDQFGAIVMVKELTNVGTKSNAYGFYSLSLDLGKYTLIYRNTNYVQQEISIDLTKDTVINVELALDSKVQEIQEVKVSAEKENANITSSEMNVTKFDPKEIEAIPVIFGEKDIVKTLQLTPGVKTAGEGNAGFYVRGGGADQNLVLLDEAPVYNASHLLGFFSVFNSDAVKDVSLYKSGIPAEYGGRASSVLDVKMKDGNQKKFGASGGIGLISSRLSVEGPIVKDKGSFILSGRRSYLDIFLGLSNRPEAQNAQLYFYDFNAKANYRISDKDRVFLSGYFGRDKFGIRDQFGFNYGNATGTLRWNRIISQKLFSNTSVIFSNFDYAFEIGQGDDAFGIKSGIQDWNLKQDFSLYANQKNSIKFGVNAIYHTFSPGRLEAGGNTSFNEIELPKQYALELGAYIQNDMKLTDRINIMYGLRYSAFNYMGEGNAYTFEENGDIKDTTTFDRFETIKYHQGLEPRLSMSYIINERSSIKAGYNRNYQYIHQLSNSTTSSPTDVWTPSTNNIKPQIADQVALGYYQNFKDNMYAFSTEVYYKTLQNQIDYRNGANLFLNQFIESDLVFGKGKAYGVELQLQKKKGKFTGWVGYTLSRALRQFEQINDGEVYSARQDRIHDLSVVAIYKINRALTVSSSFVYYTGDAVTFPSGKYEVDGQLIPFYTERNGYRLPDYHRLDFGLTWYFKERKSFEHNMNFSVYNVYGRENAFTITFEEDENNPGQTKAIQTALFKVVPSITYNFNFK